MYAYYVLYNYSYEDFIILLIRLLGLARLFGTSEYFICHTTYLISKSFFKSQWCGVGNIAATNQSDIGIYQRTDLCCRAHDKCPIKLRPFKHGFGLFNARPHTGDF